jgi:hypothetical protein
MIRTLTLLVAAGILAACEQHREPRANCFNLVSRGPTSVECRFEPIGGPAAMDVLHE